MTTDRHPERTENPLLWPGTGPLFAADVIPKKGRHATFNQLSDAAFAIFPARASRPGKKLKNAKRPFHELSVHEVGVNTQNGELQRIELELEASRNRFPLLYDGAPVGYLTLDTAGPIGEAKLMAGRLLGVARQELLDRYFAQFATTAVETEFTRLLTRAFGGLSQHEGLMATRRAGRVMFYARLVITVERADEARPTQCLVAFDDVTSLYLTERNAREYLAQLMGITAFAMDGMITVDGPFRVMLFNRAAETRLGRRSEGMMGRPINLLTRTGIAEMRPKGQGSGTAAGDGAPMVNGFFRVGGQRADGAEFPLEASVSEVEVDGSIFHTAILRHVSRRMQAEAERRRLAAILDHSSDAIPNRDRENIITTWNCGVENMFGYTVAEIVGNPNAMLASRLNHAHTRTSAAEGEGNPLRERIDATPATKNGGIRTVSVKQSSLRNAGGEITDISETLRDVTRQRVAEKIIRESEAAFTDSFEDGSIGLVSVRPGGVGARTNQINLSMVGRTKTSVVDQPAAHRFADPESVGKLSAELRRHHTVENFRSELKTADGSRVDVLIDAIRADPMRGQMYTHWFIRDITARIDLENRFLKAIEEERMLLGAELHNDLGQQLTGIRYLCDAKALVQTTKVKKHSMRAKKIALVLHRAITPVGLLAAGLSAVGVEGIGLDEVVLGVAESIRSLYKCECNVRCDRRVHFDDQATQIHVYRFIQEAMNNAVRESHAGRIDVSAPRKSGAVKFTVEDDSRGVNAARADRGSGISLKIIRYRAEACGGSVVVEPQDSGGVLLTSLIPVQCNLRPRPKE